MILKKHTFIHVKSSVSFHRRPETIACSCQWLCHLDCFVVSFARLLINKTSVFWFITVHMISIHLCHQIILWAFWPSGQTLQLFCGTFRPLDIDTCLEVELKTMIIWTGVKIGLRIAAFIQSRSSFGITEEKWPFERTFDRLGISSKHGVHWRVASNVVTQRFKCVKICFTVT